MAGANEIDRAAQDREVDQPQQVELEQADLLHLLHRVLGGGDRLGLLVAALGPLERHMLHQRLA